MIAQEVYARITTPILHQFLGQLESIPEALVQGIIEKLQTRLGDKRLELSHFDLVLDSRNAPGVLPFVNTVRMPKLADLLIDPGFAYPAMPLICLLLVRLNGDLVSFPGDGLILAEGDRLLFWGSMGSHHRLQFLVQREDLFEAVLAERHRVHSQ